MCISKLLSLTIHQLKISLRNTYIQDDHDTESTPVWSNSLTCRSCDHPGRPECWEWIGCQSGSGSWELRTTHQSHASAANSAADDPDAYNYANVCSTKQWRWQEHTKHTGTNSNIKDVENSTVNRKTRNRFYFNKQLKLQMCKWRLTICRQFWYDNHLSGELRKTGFPSRLFHRWPLVVCRLSSAATVHTKQDIL